ncbi:MAG: type 1 glutamine amidotransferase [Candidatus Bathyarchaeota archaeon]|nr:type 1 glutamine amidotransferase [Candidatus Bathyarchaeota archaeon]
MRVLVIQNDETETLGQYVQYMKNFRVGHTVLHAYRMDPDDFFPPVDYFDAFIVGPTPISANDIEEHPYLRGEWDYLGEIIDSGKPCLGVCCGGQMLARKLCAQVRRSPQKEIGGYEVRLTEEGMVDPLFAGFPREFPVFHWHGDMFEIPPDGRLLVEGDPCHIQAFGWGNVRGVIFHLEIDRREAGRWADAHPAELDAVGKTRRQVLEECSVREPQMRELASLLMYNFLNLT